MHLTAATPTAGRPSSCRRGGRARSDLHLFPATGARLLPRCARCPCVLLALRLPPERPGPAAAGARAPGGRTAGPACLGGPPGRLRLRSRTGYGVALPRPNRCARRRLPAAADSVPARCRRPAPDALLRPIAPTGRDDSAGRSSEASSDCTCPRRADLGRRRPGSALQTKTRGRRRGVAWNTSTRTCSAKCGVANAVSLRTRPSVISHGSGSTIRARTARDPLEPKLQRGSRHRNPGGDLLSQGASPQVPSARAGLTAVFGMGTGVSPPPWPPEIVRSSGAQLPD